jgi:hypothetical protein
VQLAWEWGLRVRSRDSGDLGLGVEGLGT